MYEDSVFFAFYTKNALIMTIIDVNENFTGNLDN